MLIYLLLQLFSASSYAQYTPEVNHDLDLDLSQFCHPEAESSMNAMAATIAKRRDFVCKVIKELEDNHVDPIEIPTLDDAGRGWKIRFHFGFSRTQYDKTDLQINSKVISAVVNDVEMFERTSAQHYNPATWNTLQSYGQWIDEPTNTFTFSLEKKNNILYITVFHPKYLKSLVYTKTEVNGEPHYEFGPIAESDNFSSPIPQGANLLYLGNTHFNLIWQVGYGRQFVFFNHRRYGKLSYTVKGDIGIQSGKARSVHIIPGVAWDDYYDKMRVQGINTSIGHRIEYQRGRVSLFIDQKTIYSRIEHGFYDGTIRYDLHSSPTTFGVGVDLFRRRIHKAPVTADTAPNPLELN